MVYSPTAWKTNDVITKDKLNKIEQGVKTGTLLSGTDIDTDKNWQGKKISNAKYLEVETLDGIIPVPPASNRLITVPTITVSPVTIATYPGPYRRPGNKTDFWYTIHSFTIPSSFAGIPSPYRLVKITISYTMSSVTNTGKSAVSINGVDCEMNGFHPGGTISKTLYVSPGSTLAFRVQNPSNDMPEPVITNIGVVLHGGYPFGEILATEYSSITGSPGATLAPYHLSTHQNIECTCDFDGALATMGDCKARPFFPQQPGKIAIAWKSGSTWTSTEPVLKFYRSRL